MRGLRGVAFGGALLVAVGCGGSNGSSDPTQIFVGVWKGTAVTTIGGGSTSRAITLPIEEVSPSTVKLHGFCGSGTDIYSDGPTASVEANHLTLTPGSCTFAGNGCTGTFQVVSGNAVLTTGVPSTLSVSVSATISGCGAPTSETINFTSTVKQPYGTNARAPGDAPDAAMGATGVR